MTDDRLDPQETEVLLQLLDRLHKNAIRAAQHAPGGTIERELTRIADACATLTRWGRESLAQPPAPAIDPAGIAYAECSRCIVAAGGEPLRPWSDLSRKERTLISAEYALEQRLGLFRGATLGDARAPLIGSDGRRDL